MSNLGRNVSYLPKTHWRDLKASTVLEGSMCHQMFLNLTITSDPNTFIQSFVQKVTIDLTLPSGIETVQTAT